MTLLCLETMHKFYFTHGRGLCDFAKTEIETLISEINEKDSNFSLKFCDYIEGKLSFETNVILKQLLNLTTIERLFYQIIFKKFEKTPLEMEVLQIIEQFFIISSKEETFIQTLAEPVVFIESLDNSKKIRKNPTFRIDSKLTGKWKHNLKFKNILNELISKKLKSLCFDENLTNPDFVLSCHLSQVSLIIGIPVSKLTISNREKIKNIGLRSTICSALIQLSEIKRKSSVVLLFDPFCGKSTILCELILQHKDRNFFYISSDTDKTQLDLSVENFQALSSKNVFADFLLINLSNKSKFPFRSGMFDSILTDLPFGKNHSIKYFQNSTSFYYKILKEFNRALTDKGSCVILINSKEIALFEELIKNLNTNLELVAKYPVSLGETNAVILKLIKSK